MDIVTFSDQENKNFIDTAKCLIKIPTIIYKSENSFAEENFFVLLEFLKIDRSKDCEEQIELTIDEIRCLIVLIQGVINYTETLIGSPEQIFIESFWEIFRNTIQYKKLNEIAKFSAKVNNSRNISYLDVSLSHIANELYVISLIFDNEDKIYYFSKSHAEEMKNYLSKAIDRIQESPPRLISNIYIGNISIFNVEEKTGRIEVEVEGGIFDKDSPCIAININGNLDQDDYSSTWWLSEGEALELISFLSDAVIFIRKGQSRDVGQLFENNTLEEGYPWLSIKVEEYRSNRFIKLIFDDELVRESKISGIYYLTLITAEELLKLFRKALKVKLDNPPYIYKSPEPDYITVAEIC